MVNLSDVLATVAAETLSVASIAIKMPDLLLFLLLAPTSNNSNTIKRKMPHVRWKTRVTVELPYASLKLPIQKYPSTAQQVIPQIIRGE